MAYFWTAFEWQAYDDKTAHLSLIEHGAYLQLMRNYYKNGGPLRANMEQLLRLCRAGAQACAQAQLGVCSAEIQAVQRILDEFFELRDGYYHHARCDEELAKAAQLHEIKSIAGKKGGMEAQRKKRAGAQPPAQARAIAGAPTVNKDFVLPDELVLFKEDWDQFEVMRKKIRKPLTDFARKLICKDLLRFQADGHDPGLILQKSIKNSWQDVFEPKGKAIGNDKPDLLEQIRRATQ